MSSTKVSKNISVGQFEELDQELTHLIWIEPDRPMHGTVFTPVIDDIADDKEGKVVSFDVNILDVNETIEQQVIDDWATSENVANQLGEVLMASMQVFEKVKTVLKNNPDSKPKSFEEEFMDVNTANLPTKPFKL